MSDLICTKCGASIPEGFAFCPNCGEMAPPAGQPQYQQPQYPQPQYQQPQYQQPQYQQPQYQQPVYQQPAYQQPAYQSYGNAGPQPAILPFGIPAFIVVFTWIFGFVGIILGAIGRTKGNNYISQGGTLTGASKTGYVFCKVALILGIIDTASLIFVYVFAAIGNSL